MESSNLVKVAAAFVAGIVVALGSALIYVRAGDTPHLLPASQTSVTAPVTPLELPDADSDTPPQAPVTPSPKKVDQQPTAPERPKHETTLKPALERHRRFVPATSVTRTPKPIQIAQNEAKPVLLTPASTPAVTEPVPMQTAPQPANEPDQEPPTVNSAPPQPGPVTAPAPEPHVVTLPAGTVLSVRLGETLSTDHNYTGDTFRATLLTPVIMDGFVIADKGSKVLGRVVNAQPAGHLTNTAGLRLAVTEINTTDGQRVQVQTNVFDRRGPSNAGQDMAKIAGGAALGAIIGGVTGGGKGAAIGAGAGGAAGTGAVLLTRGAPAAVQNETPLTFRLASPVTITEKLN